MCIQITNRHFILCHFWLNVWYVGENLAHVWKFWWQHHLSRQRNRWTRTKRFFFHVYLFVLSPQFSFLFWTDWERERPVILVDADLIQRDLFQGRFVLRDAVQNHWTLWDLPCLKSDSNVPMWCYIFQWCSLFGTRLLKQNFMLAYAKQLAAASHGAAAPKKRILFSSFVLLLRITTPNLCFARFSVDEDFKHNFIAKSSLFELQNILSSPYLNRRCWWVGFCLQMTFLSFSKNVKIHSAESLGNYETKTGHNLWVSVEAVLQVTEDNQNPETITPVEKSKSERRDHYDSNGIAGCGWWNKQTKSARNHGFVCQALADVYPPHSLIGKSLRKVLYTLSNCKRAFDMSRVAERRYSFKTNRSIQSSCPKRQLEKLDCQLCLFLSSLVSQGVLNR